MKMKLTLLAAMTLLSGCAFNTVPLYRDLTPYPIFAADREQCVQEASQCIVKTYTNRYYMGQSMERLLPSRGAYLDCMASKGYAPAASGFIPPVRVAMTDYRPGWDCFGR